MSRVEVNKVTRLVHRAIEVQDWQKDYPFRFHDGKEVHVVTAVISEWLEMGNWWDGEGKRRLIRVMTNQQQIYDLECNEAQDWSIYRVWD